MKFRKSGKRKRSPIKDRIKLRYAALGGILLVCMGVFVYRLVDWQLINGEQYLQQADATYVSTVNLSAARGEIVDTNGEPLAVNKTGYNVTFDQTYLDSDNQNDVIQNLIHLLDQRNEPWVDELPIVINDKGEYEFVEIVPLWDNGGNYSARFYKKYGDLYNVGESIWIDFYAKDHKLHSYRVEKHNVTIIQYNLQKKKLYK